MKLHRFIAITVAAIYCLVGAVIAAGGVLGFVAYLAATRSAETVLFFAAVVFSGSLSIVAGASLLQQRRWSRWLFVAVALLASAGFYWYVSRPPQVGLVELYYYLVNPPPEQITAAVAWQLAYAYGAPLVVTAVCWGAACIAFMHFRSSPNPSLQTTASGRA